MYIAPPPPEGRLRIRLPAMRARRPRAPASSAAPSTEADRLRARYKAIGDEQNHVFGEGLPGSKPPNFNLPLPAAGAKPSVTPAKPAAAPPAVPPAKPPGTPGGGGR